MNWRQLLQTAGVPTINAGTLTVPNPSAPFADESTQSGILPPSREPDPAVADRLRSSESADGHDANDDLETWSQSALNEFSESTNIYAKDAKADTVHEDSGEPKSQSLCQADEEGAPVSVLNRLGVRLMRLDGVLSIGVWSDLDSIEIRQALRTLKLDSLPVRYLEDAGIPMRYKIRRVAGEPVPTKVLQAMVQNPEKPWRMRDCMLKDFGVMSAKSKYSAATY